MYVSGFKVCVLGFRVQKPTNLTPQALSSPAPAGRAHARSRGHPATGSETLLGGSWDLVIRVKGPFKGSIGVLQGFRV